MFGPFAYAHISRPRSFCANAERFGTFGEILQASKWTKKWNSEEMHQNAASAIQSSVFWHSHCSTILLLSLSDNMQSVKEGIETAKAQQGALVRQTMMLMVKSGLINCGAFRVGYLGDSTDPTDLAYLVKPVILKRMARFLAEVRQV